MYRDFILVALSLLTWGVGEGMFLNFQPIYLQELGADPIAIGTILGGFGISMTIAHIPAGYLADRVGSKPIMLIAWFLGTISTWIMALAHTLPIFVVGLLLYGTTMFVLSPLNRYVTVTRGKLSIGRAFTLISAGFNVGAVIGPILGGYIGEQMGLRQTYIFAGFLFVLSTIMISFIRHQPVEKEPSKAHPSGWFFNRRYLLYLATIFLVMFAIYLPQPLTPNYLQNQQGLSLTQIGPLYSIAGVGVVVLNLVLGQFSAKTGFLLGQVSVGIFTVAIWQGSGLPWYFLGFFFLGGYKTTRTLASAQVRYLVNEVRMGLAYGTTETVNAMGMILAPPLAGLLYDYNPELIYALTIPLIVLAIFVSARYAPSPRHIPTEPISIAEP